MIRMDVEGGMKIADAIAQAVALAACGWDTVKFNFNGVDVVVNASSNQKLIYRDWKRALMGYIAKSVGPDPKPVLTAEELARDARITAEHKLASEKYEAEFRAKEQRKRENLEAKLAAAPVIDLTDEKVWAEAHGSGLGRLLANYAERWARLMQLEIAKGKKLEKIAEPTSQEADIDGISGNGFGHAVGLLSKCWKHGEQLRRWHNLDVCPGKVGENANKEGGVINPAILVLSSK